jgi:putative ABC transport system permease protein
MLVPLAYNVRSLFVRRSATLLTVLGIGATVAIVAGVLALQQGFATLYTTGGRDDLVILLRPGASNEGVSMFSIERAQQLVKGLPEIRRDAEEQPRASMEAFLAVLKQKLGGGETNVPIRGVQPMTFTIRADQFRMVEGRLFEPGSDEVIVGRKLPKRIQNTRLGDVIQINKTPMKVVGVFELGGPFDSEIWGDLNRMLQVLDRFGPNTVIAEIAPDVDVKAFAARMEEDKQAAARVMTERDYLAAQTQMISVMLIGLSGILGIVMGIAAVFTAANTMLAAIAARTHEIGILLASGFRPIPIFLSFMLEALVLCLLGGLVGCLMTLPLNGVQTGTTNFQTFTEVAFGFRVTPSVLVTAVAFSLFLGLVSGAWPAWRAARLTPTEALRRR